MRVSVDLLLCESNAVCVGLAPEVFDLDDDDVLHIITAEPPPERHDAVRRAVQSCPKQAIRADD